MSDDKSTWERLQDEVRLRGMDPEFDYEMYQMSFGKMNGGPLWILGAGGGAKDAHVYVLTSVERVEDWTHHPFPDVESAVDFVQNGMTQLCNFMLGQLGVPTAEQEREQIAGFFQKEATKSPNIKLFFNGLADMILKEEYR